MWRRMKSLKNGVINPLNKKVMTKNETVLILQAFDELSDLLTDVMDNYFRDPAIWDAVSEARTHVLQGRSGLATLFQKLLLNRD